MSAIIRGDALQLPLRDESVDLVVTSPPYFGQRSYQDDGEHYAGQIGQEPHPNDFLEALWSVMAECWRVLKPDGSVWVNLGDKRAGSGGHNNDGVSAKSTSQGNGHVGGGQKLKATRRSAPDRYPQTHFGRKGTKQLLPHRFAIGCMDGHADPDGAGWLVRQDQVWSKPNGLPDTSSPNRTQDRHEFWFHLAKTPRPYADLDPIREAYADHTRYCAEWEGDGYDRTRTNADRTDAGNSNVSLHPLGRHPYSVWEIASEPLVVPAWLDVDHFAAFPTEWPRRLILGWSPPGGVVLDPFGGTGTTAMCARALGRFGVSLDMSADYLRLARWRIFHSPGASKVRTRTNAAAQADLFSGAAS